MKRFAFIPLVFILLVSLACTLGKAVANVSSTSPAPSAATQALAPTEAAMPTVTEALQPTSIPEPTTAAAPTEAQVPPTAAVESPTATAASASSGDYFTDQFTGSISDYTRWVTVGDPKKHFGQIAGGLLTFELPQLGDIYAYAVRNQYSYANVYVEAQAQVQSGTNNSFAVVCRYSADGWDEFRVSARGMYAGTYEVYRYDSTLAKRNQVPYVNLLPADRFNSMDIKTGTARNTIGMDCSGQELRIYINGKEQTAHAKKIVDNVLTQGGVGVAVFSYLGGSAKTEFSSLLTKKP